MNSQPGNPEFPAVDPEMQDDEDMDPADLDDDEAVLPSPGEGLVEPMNLPFDEEGERVVQPEPVGD